MDVFVTVFLVFLVIVFVDVFFFGNENENGNKMKGLTEESILWLTCYVPPFY